MCIQYIYVFWVWHTHNHTTTPQNSAQSNAGCQDAYFQDFTKAWIKLQENGVPELRDSLWVNSKMAGVMKP